jgi:hypothetical protein
LHHSGENDQNSWKLVLKLQIFPNLVANDYKSHVVVNGMVTFWLISTSVWHALMLFPVTQMEVRIRNGNQHWMWNFGMKKKVQTCGCKQVWNKWTNFGAHLNEGLEHKRMHLLNAPKCLSYFGHNHGRHVHPIVEHIFR